MTVSTTRLSSSIFFSFILQSHLHCTLVTTDREIAEVMDIDQFKEALSEANEDNFLIKLSQMEDATKLLKTQGKNVKGAEEVLADLRRAAKLAYLNKEDAIHVELLRSLCKERNIKVDGSKRALVRRLLRNANYYEMKRPADKAGHRKPRKKWTEEEANAFMEGYAIYGHGKWVQIKNHSPEKLENRDNKQIREKARNLINNGDLVETYQEETWYV